MITSLFNNPYNLWGKWAAAQALHQHIALFSVALCLLAFPLSRYSELHRAHTHTETELSETQHKIKHQRQILQTLTQHASNKKLTPELAAELLPINRKIQDLSMGLKINDSRWQFEQLPLLTLQIESYFDQLKSFLLTLLTQAPQLAVSEIHIQTDRTDKENLLHSEIILQLERTDPKKHDEDSHPNNTKKEEK